MSRLGVFQFQGLFFSVDTLVSSHLIYLVLLSFLERFYCYYTVVLLLLPLTFYSLLCLCITTLPVGENELFRE